MADSDAVPPVLIPVAPTHGRHSQPSRGKKPSLDRQRIFGRVRDHLVAQGVPSVDANGHCVFRSAGGHKCAIGALISEDAHDPRFNEARLPEGPVISMLLKSGIAIDLGWQDLPAGGDDLDFLMRLQAAHDEASAGPGWLGKVETALDEVAKDFELNGN